MPVVWSRVPVVWVFWCNTEAGIKLVFKSSCPAGGNDARWPPLRVDEEAGDLVGGENSHAVELGQRRRCCCDRSSAGVTTGVPGLHKSF